MCSKPRSGVGILLCIAPLALACWMAFPGVAARAELKPAEVGILAMQASPTSQKLAQHYAEVRGVPKSQILLLPGKLVDEISRDEWDQHLRPLIHKWLVDNRFEGKIRCLVTTGDVPLKIGKRDASLPQTVARKEFLRAGREARLKQAGALIEMLDKVPDPKAAIVRPPLAPDASLDDITARFDGALRAAQARVQEMPVNEQQKQAGATIEKIFVAGGGIEAIVRMVSNRPDRLRFSVEMLQRVELLKSQMQGLQEGATALASLPDTVPRDAQLLNLLQKIGGVLGTLRWIELERDALQKNETYASFDSELSLIQWHEYPLSRWLPNPLHYQFDALSPAQRVLMMVSRLAAPTPELALRLVDQAVEVEQAGLTGKVYLDARGIDYAPRPGSHGSYGEFDQSLRDLANRLQLHSRLSVVLDNRAELFAPHACPEAALYCGWYSLGNYIDAFTWRPGAVGYHLASMEAQTLTTPGNKVWCNAMLEHGVAATLGPVYEPYLAAFPLPDDFFSLLLTGQYTLVETYYRTNPFGSWVMVLVGDPLYNPFKKNPALQPEDLPDRLKTKPAAAVLPEAGK